MKEKGGVKVILGRYMDGGAWPDTVTCFGKGQSAVGGVRTCGPAGFLSLLEEKLGLPVRDTHGSVRIAAWEGLLRKRMSGASQAGAPAARPFYASSFESDSWNTAKRLLQMRDELKEAGVLEGSLDVRAREAEAQDLPRLAEMFRLEEALRSAPVPGRADRLRFVMDELRFQAEDGEVLKGLISVELATAESCWQAPWRELFRILRSCGVEITERPGVAAIASGPLTKETVASFSVFHEVPGGHTDLEAASLPEAAEALAAVLRTRFSEKYAGDIILLRGENSVELDGALERYGLPGTGCRNRSTARPFVQVLPLFLRLQLLPFDPETLRQFLLLPICPVDADLRFKILRALKREEFAPAHGTMESWPRLWQKAFRDKDDVITDSLRKQAEWICPRERVKGTSISRKNIEELARKLQDWAEKVAKPPQPKTAELCKRLVDAAQRITVDLSPLAFEKLLDSVLGDGENSVEHRQPTPWKQINDPGQLWTELNEEDIVIWWDFTNDGSALRDSYVWSDKEKEWLGKDAFFDVKLERLARTCAMTAPFRFARRIITVTPRFHGSEEAQSHPLRDFLPKGGTVRLAASSVLTQQTCEQDFFHIAEKDSLTPPPAPAQWNENKGEAIPLPEKITPSGLETVLDCPAAWYFKDVLGLDYERTTLSNESIVCGNLAHEVMEVLLKEWRDAPVRYEKGELLKRISDQLDTLAQDKAARLALPEFDALRKGMASRLARSFIAFCDHLEKEDLVFLDSEQTYKGLVGAVECTGRYDILLGRKDDPSPCAVADMKWSRRKIYEVQTEKGRAVQLAAYHHLLKKGRKVTGFEGGEAQLAAPAPADLEKAWFFLLPDAKILGCTVPLAEQWQGIEEEWEAMCAALRFGRLLLAEDPAQDEPAEGKPARKKKDEGPCKWCAYKKLCGRTMSITDDDDEGTEDQE